MDSSTVRSKTFLLVSRSAPQSEQQNFADQLIRNEFNSFLYFSAIKNFDSVRGIQFYVYDYAHHQCRSNEDLFRQGNFPSNFGRRQTF